MSQIISIIPCTLCHTTLSAILQIMSWNQLCTETNVLILQGCDYRELLSVHNVNCYFKQLIANEARVWKNACLEHDSTILNDCVTHTPFHTCRDLSDWFQRHPLLRNVGRVHWSLIAEDQQLLEFRDLAQLLPRVQLLQIESEVYRKSVVWHSFFNPLVNNFRLTLQSLILLECVFAPDILNRLIPANFPALRNLQLRFPFMDEDELDDRWSVALSKLVQLESLELENGATVKSTEFYEPMVKNMFKLRKFTTDMHMTPEILQLFNTQLPFCTVSIELFIETAHQEHATLSENSINLLKAAQLCHHRYAGSVKVLTIFPNSFVFDTVLQYAGAFRKTIELGVESQPETWLMNNVERWKAIANCTQLRHLEIQCHKSSTVNLDHIRLLRPLYKQLQTFRLHNIILTTTQLIELENEIRQMTRLTTKSDDILQNIQWKYTI